MFKNTKNVKPARKSGGGTALMQQVAILGDFFLNTFIFNIDGLSNTKS
jgi:hypothetical protein